VVHKRRQTQYYQHYSVRDIFNPPDKSLHEWAQSQTEAEHIIKGLTVENQVMLDPLMGVGTFGIAALRLRRMFVGIAIDPEMFRLAEMNIAIVS
jgi:DNA modification methylase